MSDEWSRLVSWQGAVRSFDGLTVTKSEDWDAWQVIVDPTPKTTLSVPGGVGDVVLLFSSKLMQERDAWILAGLLRSVAEKGKRVRISLEFER